MGLEIQTVISLSAVPRKEEVRCSGDERALGPKRQPKSGGLVFLFLGDFSWGTVREPATWRYGAGHPGEKIWIWWVLRIDLIPWSALQKRATGGE
ncbi:hypothetical protein ACFX1X_044726 [Malus domestica]